MLIGILQTGHFLDRADATHGDYDDMFKRLLSSHGLTFRTWNVVDMDFPDSIAEAQGWLITGSRHGVYEDHPFIPPLEEFICRAYAKSVPLVGICFGHQIIAQALGGRVEKFSGGWGVGRHVYDFEGETLALNAVHQDQVVERPARARTIATSAFCENAALLYEGKALTIQAHPEFDRPVQETLLHALRDRGVPPDRIDRAMETLDDPLDRDVLARRIADFFKETAHG